MVAAVGILLTVLLLFMYHTEGRPKTSGAEGAMLAMTRCAAAFICSSNKHKLMTSNTKTCKVAPLSENNDRSSKTPKTKQSDDEESLYEVEYADITWAEMARIWDRFMLIVFAILTIVMNISFIIALTVGQ